MVAPSHKILIESYETDPSTITYVNLVNVISVNIEEDLNMLTDIATITISTKNTFFNRGDLYLRKNQSEASQFIIKANSFKRIFIFLGYETKLYNVFIGYITKIETNGDNIITISCENQMNWLKRVKKLMFSLDTIITDTAPDVLKSMKSEALALKHLLYYMFSEIEPEFNVFCYGQDLSQLGMFKVNDFWSIAEILNTLKERFGCYIYFDNNDLKPNKLANPNLYIGYKYNDQRQFLNVPILKKGSTSYIFSPSNKLLNLSKQVNIDPSVAKNKDLTAPIFNEYSINKKIHRFAFPYDKSANRIISHNINYQNTDKGELMVVVNSPNSVSLETLVGKYPYDEKSAKTSKIVDSGYKDENGLTLYKNEQVNSNEFVLLDKNNVNTITYNIPGLSQAFCNAKAKELYDNYFISGYAGSFTTFGEPVVQKGDIVHIILNLSEINGLTIYENVYNYVDKVERSYDVSSGYTQTITLGNTYILPQTTNYINTLVQWT